MILLVCELEIMISDQVYYILVKDITHFGRCSRQGPATQDAQEFREE